MVTRTLKFGFSDSKKSFAPFSWLIKVVYGWDSSHTYVEFENKKYPGFPLIYQASKFMTNFMLQNNFLKHNRVKHEFQLEVSTELYDKVLFKCMSLAGEKYGVWQALGMGLAKLFRLKKNYFSQKNSFVCSEIVLICLEEIGYSPKYDLELVSPKDIYDFLSKGKHSV
jgi:hypothetical protein